MSEYSKNIHPNQTAGIGGLLAPLIQPIMRLAHKKGLTSNISKDYKVLGGVIEHPETALVNALFGGDLNVHPYFDKTAEGHVDLNTHPAFGAKSHFTDKYLDTIDDYVVDGPDDTIGNPWNSAFMINPDTGKPSFRVKEHSGLTGDIYYDKGGSFEDYWDIGLNPGEHILQQNDPYKQPGDTRVINIPNLLRAVADPFTTPPVLSGQIDQDVLNTGGYVDTVWDKYDTPTGSYGVQSSIDQPYSDLQSNIDATLDILESGDFSDYILTPELIQADSDRLESLYGSSLFDYDGTLSKNAKSVFHNIYDLEKIIDDYPQVRKIMYGE